MRYEINETTDLKALAEKIKQEPNPTEVVKLYTPVLSLLSGKSRENKKLLEKYIEFHLSVNMLIVDACMLDGKFSNSEKYFEQMYEEKFAAFKKDDNVDVYNKSIIDRVNSKTFNSDCFKSYAEWITNNKLRNSRK